MQRFEHKYLFRFKNTQLFTFFSSKKKNSEAVTLSSLGVDMHSHVLPGIDDGAQNLEQSIERVQNLYELGFKKIITTPHTYKDFYPNTSAIIKERLSYLNSELEKRGIKTISAASEYFMDEHFETLLNNKDLLTLDGKHVLVEMSFYGAPPKLNQYIFELQTKGYIPILAHPERYSFYEGDLKKYAELKDIGCLFQMNILSYIGYYSPEVQMDAKKLVKAGMIDLLGTDMHHKRHADALEYELKTNTDLKKLLEKDFQNNKLFAEA